MTEAILLITISKNANVADEAVLLGGAEVPETAGATGFVEREQKLGCSSRLLESPLRKLKKITPEQICKDRV